VKKAGKLTNDKAAFARLAGGWQVLVQGQGFFQLYLLKETTCFHSTNNRGSLVF